MRNTLGDLNNHLLEEIRREILMQRIKFWSKARMQKPSWEALKKYVEKQTPRKPNYDDNGGYPEFFESWLECPDCEEPVPEYIEEEKTECYCVKCGQKLSWGEMVE